MNRKAKTTPPEGRKPDPPGAPPPPRLGRPPALPRRDVPIQVKMSRAQAEALDAFALAVRANGRGEALRIAAEIAQRRLRTFEARRGGLTATNPRDVVAKLSGGA